MLHTALAGDEGQCLTPLSHTLSLSLLAFGSFFWSWILLLCIRTYMIHFNLSLHCSRPFLPHCSALLASSTLGAQLVEQSSALASRWPVRRKRSGW